MSDYNFVAETGVIVADTSDTLIAVQGDWQKALGEDLPLDASSPQGILITAQTATRTAVQLTNAQIANQINPNLARGIFLDALCAFLGLKRAAATYTTVNNVTLAGLVNTGIPAGARAKTVAGDIFVLQTGVTLNSAGIGYGTFAAQSSGPVLCDSNTLTLPVDVVLGWETITNDQSVSSTTTLGTLQQSDASLRALRNNTLALQGISTPQAQVSGLYALTGVTSVAYLENVDASTEVINGITLTGHSIWACVDGGSDADVAASLLKNKTDGAGWNGATVVPTLESASNQTYQVKFDRPTYSLIYGQLTIKQGTYSGNLSQDAPTAVYNYSKGAIDGFSAWGIAMDVSPFAIAAAITEACPGCKVTGCSIGTVPGSLTPVDITIAQNARAITTTTAFTVTVTA